MSLQDTGATTDLYNDWLALSIQSIIHMGTSICMYMYVRMIQNISEGITTYVRTYVAAVVW